MTNSTEIDDRGYLQRLPKYSGGDCENPECEAVNRYPRVFSVAEIERIHPSKKQLPSWPIPPQATHVCEKCGYVYQNVGGQASIGHPVSEATEQEFLDRTDWAFDHETIFKMTVREAIEMVIEGRPDDATASEIESAVAQWIPGAGRADASDVLSEMDIDVVVHPASDFM